MPLLDFIKQFLRWDSWTDRFYFFEDSQDRLPNSDPLSIYPLKLARAGDDERTRPFGPQRYKSKGNAINEAFYATKETIAKRVWQKWILGKGEIEKK